VGHEVRVLTTNFHLADSHQPRESEEPDVHRTLRWYWREHSFPHMSLRARLRLERHNQAVLARHFQSFFPDVVSWWAMGGMSMSLVEGVRRSHVPAVGMVHDDWLVYGPKVDGWQRAFGHPAAVAAASDRASGIPTRLRLADAATWAFVSERVQRHAIEEHPALSTGVIAHSGIDPTLFPAAQPREWGWRLLCVGRIDRRKGIATAISALPHLPEASLAVVGGGDTGHLAELRSLADELGVDSRVRFESVTRPELGGVYAQADAVLFPVTWEEPWGLVPLEAMSVGRPVVATGTGGSGEYLRDGENSLIFAPRDDPAALASAVRRLASDRELRDRLREEGFKTASRFTEQGFNDQALAVLEEAVKVRNGAAA
jgi:glycogen(starch) synthase